MRAKSAAIDFVGTDFEEKVFCCSIVSRQPFLLTHFYNTIKMCDSPRVFRIVRGDLKKLNARLHSPFPGKKIMHIYVFTLVGSPHFSFAFCCNIYEWRIPLRSALGNAIEMHPAMPLHSFFVCLQHHQFISDNFDLQINSSDVFHTIYIKWHDIDSNWNQCKCYLK